MSMNVTAASGTSSGICIDTEYQRIIRELRSLGIEPSGSKSTDKTKLEQAQSSQTQNDVQNVQNTQFVTQVQDTEKTSAESSQDNIKNDMTIQAQQMTGATQLAEFNRYKLLGLC